MRRNLLLVLALVLATAGLSFAQGSQSGVLTGTVTSTDKAPVPGVTVTIKSDSLLGTRSSVTDANGSYIFKGLPPGQYKVTMELAGFATVEKSVTVALAGTISADASMSVASVQETVTVTAESTSPLTTTQVGANYKQEMIDSLATARTIFGVAQLAPGLSTNTPNAGQVTIAGNFAFDNVFLLDGVDINDNLFGTANNLFIEDALEETQILTSGISAEYGRFGGGVINAVTKRGGNKFAGSFRANLSKPSWRDETPREVELGVERGDTLSKFYEATLGGPIIKDHLWFFAAGRKENSATESTLPETGLPFSTTVDEKRWEAKLTGAINANHTITGTYTKVTRDTFRQTFSFSIEPENTAFFGGFPNDLFVVNYNGVLRPNLFLEAQYSKKYFEFKDFGGTSTAIVDSPYIAQSVLAHFNAPYFDATDPEERNNRQVAASLSYFLSTKSFGKHDIKVGFENFVSTRTGGNSQTSTGYVFYTDYLTDANGSPVIDSNGYVVPLFIPGVSQLQEWIPVRGAQIDLKTNSAFVNDRWTLNNQWTFNLGVRAEWAAGEATGGIKPVDASRIVPRLGASFDVRGDGKYKLDATYSHYSGKYSETQMANNTNVGNPDYIYYLYTGPEGQGRSFGPGIDPANYPIILDGGFPTANIFYADGIKSPVTKEWTGAFGMQLGQGGYAKAIYTWRDTSSFVQQYVTRSTGATNVVVNGFDFGTFANQLWDNSNAGERTYQGLQFQLGYRVTPRWRVDGHWTLQLKNDGNQEGEGTNTPGAPSIFSGYYPEIFNEARHYPIGRLNDFQKHRVRLWTIYDLGLGKFGNLNVGAIYRFDTGSAYSIQALGRALSTTQRAIGSPLYPNLPGSQTLFFADGRGSETFESSHLVDFSVNYSVPVFRTWRPWVKFEVRNAFNKVPLIGYNTTVTPDNNSPLDNLGLRTGYVKGASFGKGTSTAHYPFPREIFLSMGFRF
jgi:hypothetical protein